MRHHAIVIVFLSLAAMVVRAAEEGEGYLGVKAGGWYVDSDLLDTEYSNMALGIYGGYQITRYLGVEATYIYLDEAREKRHDTSVKLDGDIYGAFLTAGVPVGRHGDFFGKVGIAYTDLGARVSQGGARFSDNDSSTDLAAGIGGFFRPSKHWRFRAELEAVNTDDPILVYTLGVDYVFNPVEKTGAAKTSVGSGAASRPSEPATSNMQAVADLGASRACTRSIRMKFKSGNSELWELGCDDGRTVDVSCIGNQCALAN
jgi:OOP family OmpA-OmpF porin